MRQMMVGSSATSVESDSDGPDGPDGPDDTINEIQFLLEYVHVDLPSGVASAEVEFDDVRCTKLFKLSRKL